MMVALYVDDPVERVLGLLQGAKKSAGGWIAKCPAHDDKIQSLKVDRGSDGRALLKCHAGCSVEDILYRLSLSKGDLFKREGARMHDIAEIYNYRDKAGNLLFQVCRTADKQFPQRHPNGAGKWVWGLEGIERVPYRLPELLEAPSTMPVFIVEGEKDADRLWKAGLPATTNPGGAGKWRSEYNHWLSGRSVVILPDNDEPGRRHAQHVAHSLWGTAKRIKIAALPDLPPKGDVSDWLEAGRSPDALIEYCTGVPNLEEQEGQADEEPEERADPPKFKCMADVRAEPIDWLWPGFLARGKFGLWEGDPGIGKTFALLAAGTALTRGWALPGMGAGGEPSNVMLLTMEDDLSDTIRPRLDRMEADVSRFYAYDEMLQFDEAGLADLSVEMARIRPSLLIVDPIMAYIPGRVDIYKPNQIRQITNPLRMLARAHGCAIVGIRHLTKGQKDRAIYRGSGGMDFVGASRLVVLVGMDPDRPGQRAIVQTKSNLGAPPMSVNFTLEADGTFLWAGHSHASAERILAVPQDEEEKSAVEEAADFLRVCLMPYPRKSKDVFREAEDNGIKGPTLKKAKKLVGVVTSRHGESDKRGGGVWLWSLPGTGLAHADDLED